MGGVTRVHAGRVQPPRGRAGGVRPASAQRSTSRSPPGLGSAATATCSAPRQRARASCLIPKPRASRGPRRGFRVAEDGSVSPTLKTAKKNKAAHFRKPAEPPRFWCGTPRIKRLCDRCRLRAGAVLPAKRERTLKVCLWRLSTFPTDRHIVTLGEACSARGGAQGTARPTTGGWR